MNTMIAIPIGAMIFFLTLGLVNLFRSSSEAGEKRTRQRLRSVARMTMEENQDVNIVRSRSLSQVGWFNRILGGVSMVGNLDASIQQAGMNGHAGAYLLMAGVLGTVGFGLGYLALGGVPQGLGIGVVLGMLPFWWISRCRTKRMDRFTRQLPDALDLVARALKAGNTFPGGLKMVADEFDDPIGTEFQKTQDEINFGVSVDRALANLQARVDSPDLKFFVVSVNIQRETGGNLSEIVEKIAALVRERFELFGRIRVLSAEGRVSAMILVALPFIIAFIIYLVNPGYMMLLVTTQLGKAMIGGSLVMMAVGVWVIRRMIRIKV